MMTWRKSSYSGSQADCVEVGTTRAGGVRVRDTKEHGYGPELAVCGRDWRRFLTAVRAGHAVR